VGRGVALLQGIVVDGVGIGIGVATVPEGGAEEGVEEGIGMVVVMIPPAAVVPTAVSSPERKVY
jgi:hypothetical protein